MSRPLLDQLTDLPPDEVGLAVLGYPIAHSISPQLHGAALEVLAEKEAEFKRWHYRKIEVPPEDLHIALPRLAQLGFRGLNLTIPIKWMCYRTFARLMIVPGPWGQSIP